MAFNPHCTVCKPLHVIRRSQSVLLAMITGHGSDHDFNDAESSRHVRRYSVQLWAARIAFREQQCCAYQDGACDGCNFGAAAPAVKRRHPCGAGCDVSVKQNSRASIFRADNGPRHSKVSDWAQVVWPDSRHHRVVWTAIVLVHSLAVAPCPLLQSCSVLRP
jgi:hypothetical protein